jgi:hypothetical protein
MSDLRVTNLRGRTAGSSPTLPDGAVVTGVLTATTFNGNITGTAATFSGNVSIAGTLTYEDVTNVDSVGLITARTGIVVNAGGLVVTGVSTFNSGINGINVVGGGLTVTGISTFANDVRFRGGVVENVSAATTYTSGGALVLELDVRNSTVYRYTMVGGNIGIVSFKNMPANTENGTTVTVLFTQQSTTPSGVGNTTAATGIGTNCTVIPFVSGAAIAGISTRALVGSATTTTLSTTANDRDFVSFFVHYTGGTNTTASSYQVYATKNGGFRQGTVGV